MSYAPIEAREGVQPIALAANSPNHPLGTIVRAFDASYGEGEFIYLLGVSGTVTGSVVTWGGVAGSGATAKPTWQTTLAPATANLGQPLAVAMAATGAGQFGWYQIAGTAVVAENATFAAASKAYLAGSGQLTTTQANGRQVVGAVTVTSDGTPAAGFGLIHISRPFAQGQTV
jgi:hypothetical protein